MNPQKTGLTLGILVGGLHVFWSLLVALGLAQGLVDFIFMLHMIVPNHQIASFNLMYAIALVLIALVKGYVVGYLFALLWNYVSKK
ncbi:MAG: hypothetical protein AAB400_03180 [Patescibacteria group bacterium]